MTCVVARNKQTMRTRKRKNEQKKENDYHIMHLKNLISLNKSQESQVQKKNAEKIMINTNHFSLARNYSSV